MQGRSIRSFALLACLLLLQACASDAFQRESNIPPEQLLAGDSLLTVAQSGLGSPFPPDDILSIDAEMRAFAEHYVPRRGDTAVKVQALVDALISPANLGIRYDFRASGTAAETFHSGRANCLAFAHLFVALARHVGLKAHYQETRLPPTWAQLKDSGTFYFVRHVNVHVPARRNGRSFTVDINAPKGIRNYQATRITDSRAFSQHYNNLAVRAMDRGRTAESLAHYREAIRLAPRDAALWANLGTLYRRNRLFEHAESAYFRALKINRSEYVALSNLASLYGQTGDEERQAMFAKRIQKVRDRNPYYRYRLARQAVDAGRYAEAERHLAAALSRVQDGRFLDLRASVRAKREAANSPTGIQRNGENAAQSL